MAASSLYRSKMVWIVDLQAQACGYRNGVTSCDLRILMDQSAVPISPQDADVFRWSRVVSAVKGRLHQTSMRSVLANTYRKMAALSCDEDPVGAFAANASDPTFGDSRWPAAPALVS
jgi:hypothetical protein